MLVPGIPPALQSILIIANGYIAYVLQRLSSIQGADVIFVFSGGRIVEKGNHEMLVRKRGIYFQMVGIRY